MLLVSSEDGEPLTVDLRGFLPEASLLVCSFRVRLLNPRSSGGDRLRWGVCSSLKTPFHKVLRPERRGCLSSRQRTSLPDSAGLEFLRNFRRHSARDSEDGGPLTANAVFISDQRVLDFKRAAVLRIEMLKQVHDAERGYRLQGTGSHEQNRLNNSGFLCT